MHPHIGITRRETAMAAKKKGDVYRVLKKEVDSCISGVAKVMGGGLPRDPTAWGPMLRAMNEMRPRVAEVTAKIAASERSANITHDAAAELRLSLEEGLEQNHASSLLG
jgi:hypothetical protein